MCLIHNFPLYGFWYPLTQYYWKYRKQIDIVCWRSDILIILFTIGLISVAFLFIFLIMAVHLYVWFLVEHENMWIIHHLLEYAIEAVWICCILHGMNCMPPMWNITQDTSGAVLIFCVLWNILKDEEHNSRFYLQYTVVVIGQPRSN